MAKSTLFILTSLILTISLPQLGCRTLTVEQKLINARLDEWQDLVEDAEFDAEQRAKAWTWAKKLNREKSAAIRAAIIQALPKLNLKRRDDIRDLALETLKTDPHGMVRLECIEILAYHKDNEVRAAIADVLTRRNKSQLLVEDSAEVRAVAARCLGQLGDTNGALPLLIGLKDPVDWVRVQAENSLHKLRGDQIGRSFEEWKRWVRELEQTRMRKEKEEREARERAEAQKEAMRKAEEEKRKAQIEKEERLREEEKQKESPETPN